jgi:hypothetical protein
MAVHSVTTSNYKIENPTNLGVAEAARKTHKDTDNFLV